MLLVSCLAVALRRAAPHTIGRSGRYSRYRHHVGNSYRYCSGNRGGGRGDDARLGLLVVSLPYAFVNLPTGELYGMLIMASISLSSLAALIALIEPMVAILARELDIPRLLAMGAIAIGLYVLRRLG